MNTDEMMALALKALELVEQGTVLEVKSLFEGYRWEQLSTSDRRLFGKVFAQKYREGAIPGIQRIERGKDNHARYVKL